MRQVSKKTVAGAQRTRVSPIYRSSKSSEREDVMNLSSSMIALSILSSGSGSSGSGSAINPYQDDGGDMPAIEGSKARAAKKAFTTVKAAAPWESKDYKAADPAQLSAIRSMKSITAVSSADKLPADPDLRATFIAYRAVDRLQVLAQAAAKAGISTLDREQLQRRFELGLGQLRSFVENAGTDKLTLYYGKASASVQSFALNLPSYTVSGRGDAVASAPDAALTGLSGREVLEVHIGARGSARDTIRVDLSTGPQPPTLKSVVGSINAAIAAVTDRLPDGTIMRNGDGSARSRWSTRFEVREVSKGHYAIGYSLAAGEFASIGEEGAGDALMVAVARHGKSEADAVQLRRVNDPVTDLAASRTVGNDVSVDRAATARKAADIDAKESARKSQNKDHVRPDPTVNAGLTVHASASDADGNSYLVGTARGDYGAVRSDGNSALFLTKVDSGGHVLWRRALATTSHVEGAAISVDRKGNVSVAGTVAEKASAPGAIGHDADLLVARFDSSGEQLTRATIQNIGSDLARGVVADADGNIVVAGSTVDRSGARAGLMVRVDASGAVTQRVRVADVDEVRSVAIDAAGSVLALTGDNGGSSLRRYRSDLSGEMGHRSLGTGVQATALAVASDGRIGVAGATSSAVAGDQANARAGARDAFVTIVSDDLSGARTSYIGGSSDEVADSLAFSDGQVYVGGRTYGSLSGARGGVVDGFVARVSTSDGTVGAVSQFGAQGDVTGGVEVSVVHGGRNHLGLLGLSSGELAPRESAKIVDQTGIRPVPSGMGIAGLGAISGDTFRLQLDDGVIRTIAITADDTLASLRDKLKKVVGKAAMISLVRGEQDRTSLKISALPGHKVTLLHGVTTAEKGDALAMLGFTAGTVSTPVSSRDVKIRPGGRYGLNLADELAIVSKESAAQAAQQLASAAGELKRAYGSLFWNAGKAQIADGRPAGGGGGSAADRAKLASYKDALARLSAVSSARPTGSLL
ncbi:hypothetical protein KZ813_01630 [Sphingomonas sp. RHCKR7]|uniref:hypothetical protein n=1 Tax=Sphingomonas folli TaxID=2862497 RepID=UPI001CA55DD0|nr:hypothetical protein [Sphingomonas folli]MBW6525533.1 hypothetical protein [Sphingomonas folli]